MSRAGRSSSPLRLRGHGLRHPLLHSTRQMRNLADHPLHQHQLSAMMHLVLFRAEQHFEPAFRRRIGSRLWLLSREKQLKEVVMEPTNYFDERARKEFLEQCVEGSMIPDVTVFSTAWLIEKDLSEFYEKMADQTEGRARDALRMLSSWEKGHEKFFREYRDKLSDVYAHMPWGG